MPQDIGPSPIRLLEKEQVAALLGVSPFTLLAWVRKGLFPRPIKLTECHRRKWREIDIVVWMTRLQRKPPKMAPRGALKRKAEPPPRRRIERIRFVPKEARP